MAARLGFLALALQHAGAQVNTAIAVIRASRGYNHPVEGTVKFTQSASDPLGDVTVEVNIRGLAQGSIREHGFHVHQYGDTRNTSDLSTMSAHFVPYCVP